MRLLSILLVPFIVGSVLNYLNNKTKANAKTRSLKKFVVKLPVDMAYLGMMGVGLPIAIKIYGIVRQDEMGLGLDIGLILLAVPGLMLLFGPIKGIWDVRVDGDDVTVVKAFLFRRHWKISKISHCKMGRGGLKVYVEGRKRKAFFVDGMCEHFSNFMKRMEKEGKEIIYPAGAEEETDGGADNDEAVNEE